LNFSNHEKEKHKNKVVIFKNISRQPFCSRYLISLYGYYESEPISLYKEENVDLDITQMRRLNKAKVLFFCNFLWIGPGGLQDNNEGLIRSGVSAFYWMI
jgi:hypothetical protein